MRDEMLEDRRDDVRELSIDELETVSGGSQYPIGWPDGPFGH
jgi:bacteriocin-like protein